MLKRHTFRVQNQDGKWTVRYNGSEVGSRRLFLKNSAIEDARSLALANQPSEVLVEEADGQCRTIGIYGVPNLQAVTIKSGNGGSRGSRLSTTVRPTPILQEDSELA